jgi:hypothetical protein
MIDEQNLREVAGAAVAGDDIAYDILCEDLGSGVVILALLDEMQSLRSERTALLVNEQNLREELEALKAAMGEPVAEIIISDDDFFDKGLADDYAFGRKTRTNGTHQLYALTNKETK